MSKLKVPVPSIVIDSYNDMYYDNPQHSPETTTTSMGSTTSSEEGDTANVPIKLSINELHDMVTKMMMQRYHINPNEKSPRYDIPSSPTSPTSDFARRASHVILEFPASIAVGGLKKIAHNKNMGSMSRETDHFCGITTVHGPNRIYNGKGAYRYFWALAMLGCLIALSYQIGMLIKEYYTQPISTEIQMTMPPDGLTFPTITICNYNAIRKSYIDEVNQTGDFSNLLLNYVTLSNLEVQFISSINSSSFLQQGNETLTEYINNHKDFNIKDFYAKAGFSCQDILKICSFGGRQFNCCEHALPVLTDMGQCFRIQLDESSYTWLHSQKQAGINNGLQIIADTNTEEQISSPSIYKNPDVNGLPLFANQLSTGLRFYVHIPRDLPHLVGDGISVAPGGIIYSSITPSQYTLLAKDEWGNCIESWPKDISLSGDYSSARCQAFCRAKYFNNKCGCSPFVYDLDEIFTPCTPYKLYECIKDEPIDSLEEALKCSQCSIECDRWTYSTSNSYDFGYSPGAYEWFNERSSNWTEGYVKDNFVALNIFYKELAYSHFQQNQGSNLVVLLSNIGGNMGMFVGMSLLSCTEVIIFFSKISWILFSKKRRNYLKQKKDQEKEREQRLDETLKNIKFEAAKAAEENETKLEKTLKNIQNEAIVAFKQAEETAEENETKLEKTLKNIKNEAIVASKQAEEDARKEKEKSIFSLLPAINTKVRSEDDFLSDV